MKPKTAVFYILFDIFLTRPSLDKLSKNAPRIFDTLCINKF